MLIEGHVESERLILERKDKGFLAEKPEYRQLVTYVPDKKEPVYGWFKYKEAFSRILVERICQYWQLPKESIICVIITLLTLLLIHSPLYLPQSAHGFSAQTLA